MRTSFLAPALTAAVYLAAAVALTWPLAFHLSDKLGSLQGPGDPYLNLWILGWGLRAWTSNPASIWSGDVFNANIFYPAENTLAYSDHFLLQSLALSPVYALTGDVVLCYNVLLIASIALSGVAMHAFVRAVTGSHAGACVAGLAWACWPFRTAHFLHLQLQAMYFMPLALLCVHRLTAGRRWRDAFALAVVCALQIVASIYYGFMTVVAVAITGVALALTTGQWRNRRLIGRAIAAAVLTGGLVAPVLFPYLRSQQAEGFGRTMYEASNHSATFQSYLQVPRTNALYGATGLLAPRPSRPGTRDRTGVEHTLFSGFIVLALAVFGAIRNWRRDARPLVWASALLVAAGVALSFGPEGFRNGYAFLHDNVYGFQAIRAPARFAVVAMLGLATLAALGLRVVGVRWEKRPLVIAIVAAALVEYLNVPLALVTAPVTATQVGQWLRQAAEPGAVLYLPLGNDLENTPFMVQSLEHGRPIVNGYSGQRPAFFSAVVESLADLPAAEAYATLKELDVKFVVSQQAVAGAGHPRSPLVERARLADGIVYETRWTPEVEASLSDVNVDPPPPPGPIPFAAGERATYEVHWDGGPINLPAGRATIRVLAGDAGSQEQWEFEAAAETADWVSSFFQARDRFTTTATAELEPIEHTREIREGRRRLDRVFVFDRNARVVRIGESAGEARRPDALTLPLGVAQTRDVVTAFFYFRTLTLYPGAIVTVPLNEAGSRLVLQVAAAGHETITVRGQSIATLRLEPRLMRRLERRRPLTMTVWLTTDDRKLPVRAFVDAGFGRVRADLVDYRR